MDQSQFQNLGINLSNMPSFLPTWNLPNNPNVNYVPPGGWMYPNWQTGSNSGINAGAHPAPNPNSSGFNPNTISPQYRPYLPGGSAYQYASNLQSPALPASIQTPSAPSPFYNVSIPWAAPAYAFAGIPGPFGQRVSSPSAGYTPGMSGQMPTGQTLAYPTPRTTQMMRF